MFTQTVTLAAAAPGAAFMRSLLHCGEPGAGPKAYIQGGLHGDEGPGMLCAHRLRAILADLEARGAVRGYIAQAFMPLARWLGAVALRTAKVSGGRPFDEVISRPWAQSSAGLDKGGALDVPVAGTVALRGHQDMDRALAKADADAILNFLALRGHLAIEPARLPGGTMQTDAAGRMQEHLRAGVGLRRVSAGSRHHARRGNPVADIVDPVSGALTTVRAQISGVFFARSPTRLTQPGRGLDKIAGAAPFRTGYLLSP